MAAKFEELSIEGEVPRSALFRLLCGETSKASLTDGYGATLLLDLLFNNLGRAAPTLFSSRKVDVTISLLRFLSRRELSELSALDSRLGVERISPLGGKGFETPFGDRGGVVTAVDADQELS